MRNTKTPAPQSRRIFLDWYAASSFGQVLQSLEASYLQSSLKLTYNHRTLQVGQTGSEALYIDPDFRSGFAILEDEPLYSPYSGPQLRASIQDWPIASESLDNLVLAHVIEFESNRHRVLQEAERVLKPEGHLLILCLNPLSLHGIVQYLPHSSSYWRTDFVTSYRLMDWLSLLKFDSEYSAAFGITASQAILRPASFWERTRAELSFSYAVTAIKRQYRMIPLEQSWLPVPSLAGSTLFERADPDHST